MYSRENWKGWLSSTRSFSLLTARSLKYKQIPNRQLEHKRRCVILATTTTSIHRDPINTIGGRRGQPQILNGSNQLSPFSLSFSLSLWGIEKPACISNELIVADRIINKSPPLDRWPDKPVARTGPWETNNPHTKKFNFTKLFECWVFHDSRF